MSNLPPDPKPDPSQRWLWFAVGSFGLMLILLYLGQGLPSLLYVVLVLGLLLFSLLSLVISHLHDLLHIGQQIRSAIQQSRANAVFMLLLALLVVGLKWLGVW